MTLKLSNNASSLLSTGISASSTTLAITSGDEGNFPTLLAGDWCPITVVDPSNNMEIMRCTARSGVTLTVTRGQEGTTAKIFSAGARVESRLTVAALLALDLTGFTGKLPIGAGGSNAQTAMEAYDNLSTISAPIASATTTDLSTASGVFVPITGNVTITGFGTEQAGARRYLKFSGAPTLTYNATSMILPGAADIVVQANDVAHMESLGGGNWQMLGYSRASGKPLAGLPAVTIDNEILRADGTTGIAQGSGVTIGDDKVIAGAAGLKLESTDAGATAGPIVELYRNSASPADGDVMAELDWYANITGGAKTLLASIRAVMLAAASGTTVLEFRTMLAGTFARRLALGAGLFMNGALGGDKGVDTINAGSYFLNGLPTSARMLSNLKVEVISASQVQVTAAGGLNVTVDLAVTGVNGLDTGAEAANNWYNIWLVWNGTTVGGVASLSATAPTMPGTYTQKLFVGTVRNDASANLWRMIQYGDRAQIVIGTNPAAQPIIASGSQGNPDGPTFVPFALANFVPPTAVVGWFGTYKGNNQRIILAPNANYGAVFNSTNPPFLSQDSTNEHADNRAASVSMVLESGNVHWAATGSSVLTIQGWQVNL